MLEALLAYAHLLAILSWVVFLTSQTALARAEWLNAAALQRLVLVARIANIAAAAVLATGLARVAWGVKGPAWTLAQPLLWAKLALFALMAIAAWQSTRQIKRWHTDHQRSGALPSAAQITQLRQRLMRATHLMVWLPLLGVLLARGLLTR
ncbi:DUF2214 family protein [Aquabacterium sp.]|uniref:DUF2214 family protein n=1 Tax=Aquabacterium sp. TaxID=1872578 RepID=UPI0037845D78